MKSVYVAAIVSAFVVVGCSGGASEAPGEDLDASLDASAGETSGEAAAEGGTGCTTDDECAKALPVTTPADCATAKCTSFGRCEFKARDADGDGYAAAKCSAAGVTIVTGDDCNDDDKAVYPGAACAASGWTVDKGSVGLCKVGKWSCTSGSPVCEGAVGPAARDCTSTTDNDCDGKPDNDTTDGVCACGKEGDKKSCTIPTGAVGTPCGPGSQTCQKDPIDSKKLIWSPCLGTNVVQQVKGACGDCTYCNSGPACTPLGLKTCTSSDGCTTSSCSCTGWTGIAKKISVSGECGACTYCPGATPCTAPVKTSCTSADGCTTSLCSCSGWTGVSKRSTKYGAPGCSCTYCPGGDCTVPAPTKCPDSSWTFEGSGVCTRWDESSVEIKDGTWGGSTSQSPPVAGAIVKNSQARMDYSSGGCYCSDTYDAATITCSGGGGTWGPLSQRNSGCNSSPVGITVLSPVLSSAPYSCTFNRSGGWTPAFQGTCWKRGVLRIQWQVGATC